MQTESLPHALFLQTIQNWVRSYVSTQQLSATDLFFALEWAESGVRPDALTDHLDRYIAQNPEVIQNGIKLSKLRWEAERYISAIRQKAPETLVQPMVVSDPFVALLDAIADIGRSVSNAFIKDILRTTWKSIHKSHQRALTLYPDWNTSPTAYYQLKAYAITTHREACQTACCKCSELLTPQELEVLTALTPQEQIRALTLGEEATKRFLQQCHNEKIAARFELTELLNLLGNKETESP